MHFSTNVITATKVERKKLTVHVENMGLGDTKKIATEYEEKNIF